MAQSSQARVHVVNRALLKLGLPPSYTIDAETEMGGVIDLVWDGTAAKAMALYDWSFCRRTSPGIAISAAPENGWAYGFTLPGDRVGEPLAVLDAIAPIDHLLRDFALDGGVLYTNCTPVWVRCRVMLDPAYWDAGFAEGFATGLAADLSVPLIQDEDLGAQLAAAAYGRPQENGGGGLFGRLIAQNRAASPPGRNFMADDPLTNARFM